MLGRTGFPASGHVEAVSLSSGTVLHRSESDESIQIEKYKKILFVMCAPRRRESEQA
jgi:hypothetical protein